MANTQDRLRVFISSRMHELVDVRAVLDRELERLGIEAFVYEAALGAQPDDPETASLRELERSDILVLVIDESWGEITEREYDKARELNKPCLVYERVGNAITDPELQRFLKKISGPRGVPSRTTFQNAVDLAAKVAKDVQGWLVREYRRLSAAQLDAGDSSRHASDIKANMQRLAASANHSLESGNSSDLLAWQLQQWFEALDYPAEKEPETGDRYTDLVIRVPARRRQFTRTLVRAKDGAVELVDVERASEALTGSIEEVWLVSLRRVTPAARFAARELKNVLLYTLDELIEEDVNFETYFDWLDTQARKADIDRLYVPLAVTVNEVDRNGAFGTSSTYENVAEYVDQWLQDPDREHLSLLGEFGTGKSWFALKYAHDMVEEYRRAQKKGLQRPRLPLVIRLREYARGFKDVGALLTEFVFREHEIRIPSVRLLETLNRMGRLLFIFDGFDEMAARVDQQKMIDNFWALAAVLGVGSKAILTCRSEYFRFARQAREVLGGKLRGSVMNRLFETAKFQVATLEMLDEPRLRKALSLRSNESVAIEAVLANPKLVDLVRRPIMIELLLEAMPNLKTESVDLAQVYYQAVKRKMERDIRSERTFTSIADKMFFMCEISWEMLSGNQLKINYREIPERIRTYFGSQTTAADEDYWRHDLLSQTMLVRDDDGYYHPAHKSLIEFFSAYKLSAAIGALQGQYLEAVRGHQNVNSKLPPAESRWSEYFRSSTIGPEKSAPLARFSKEGPDQLANTWGRLALNDSISEMIVLLSGQSGLMEAVRELNEPELGEIASRVLQAGAFTGKLQGVNLSGAALRKCRLNSCDLSGGDLSNSEWTGGTLGRVSLEGAILRGARFEEINFASVDLRRADLSNSTFVTSRFFIDVATGVWCVLDGKEILIAVLNDRRVVAILPEEGRIVPLDQAGLGIAGGPRLTADWLFTLRDRHKLEPLGDLTFPGVGWRASVPWQQRLSSDSGVRFEYEVRYAAHGDVELLDATLRDQQTGGLVFSRTIADPSDIAGSGTRALAVSGKGRRMVTVSGKVDGPETATLLLPKAEDDIPLPGFDGWGFSRGADTFDNRGASFSPTETLLAVCARQNVIGFWRADTGAFVGRVRFHTPCEGCITDGASGLPVWMTPSNPGWTFETEAQAGLAAQA